MEPVRRVGAPPPVPPPEPPLERERPILPAREVDEVVRCPGPRSGAAFSAVAANESPSPFLTARGHSGAGAPPTSCFGGPAGDVEASTALRLAGAPPSVVAAAIDAALLRLARAQMEGFQRHLPPGSMAELRESLLRAEQALATFDRLKARGAEGIEGAERALRTAVVSLALDPPRDALGRPEPSAAVREYLIETHIGAVEALAQTPEQVATARIHRLAAQVELAGESGGPAAAESIARQGFEVLLGLPPGGLSLDLLGLFPPERAKAAAAALDATEPATRAAIVRAWSAEATRARAMGRPGLLIAASESFARSRAPELRLAASSAQGELHLAAGAFGKAREAFEERLALAESLDEPEREQARRASLLSAGEAALAELQFGSSAGGRDRARSSLRELRDRARSLGIDTQELNLMVMTGAALAGRGNEARAILKRLRGHDDPRLQRQLDTFSATYQQKGWTAAAETLIAELCSASLGETVAFQGGFAALGASFGLLGGPVSVAAGAGVGYLFGVGLLLAKKGIEGRHRIDEAWTSGIDAHRASETALNAAFLAFDFIELGAAVRGAKQLAKGSVLGALFGRRGGEAARLALDHAKDRIARELAAASAAPMGRGALDAWAQKALLDAWRDAATEAGLPALAASASVAAAVLAPEAAKVAEAMARGDTAQAEMLMAGALQLATLVAALAFGEAALVRFLPTESGNRAAIEAALLRARPEPPTAMVLDSGAYQRRLEDLSAWTEGADRAGFDAARQGPAFFDPVTGKIVFDRARIASLDDAELSGLLHHELTHARLHALDPEAWAGVKAELKRRPDFAELAEALLDRNPRLRGAGEDRFFHEVLAEAAQDGRQLLSEATTRRLGLDAEPPRLSREALLSGERLRLPSEGVFSRRSAALEPDAARSRKPVDPARLQWGNPKSSLTYGHTFSDHGQKVRDTQLIDRARSKGHQIGAFTNDQAAAEAIAEVARSRGPGVHELPIGDLGARCYLPDGTKVNPDILVVVVQLDGSVKSAYPKDSAHAS